MYSEVIVRHFNVPPKYTAPPAGLKNGSAIPALLQGNTLQQYVIMYWFILFDVQYYNLYRKVEHVYLAVKFNYFMLMKRNMPPKLLENLHCLLSFA